MTQKVKKYHNLNAQIADCVSVGTFLALLQLKKITHNFIPKIPIPFELNTQRIFFFCLKSGKRLTSVATCVGQATLV